MRTALVFSTRNDDIKEFENIWKRCPAKQVESQGQVVIGGRNWQLVAFNGRNRKYYDGRWKMEIVNSELAGILDGHMLFSLGTLFHGTRGELKSVVEELKIPTPQEVYSKSYTSKRGTFFRKYIKPFSIDGSDAVFEKLWHKLKDGDPEVLPKEEAISAARHQMKSNFVLSLKLIDSFSRKPTEEMFGKIHRLLLETGSLDRADEILSDLKSECEGMYLRDHPEITKIDKSLCCLRSFLASGFDPDLWTQKNLDEFEKLILYLSDRE